jgi:single-strand DNA-binding protein
MSDLKLPRVNRVLLAGRVTRDFALRYTVSQVPVVMFTVAFNRPVKNEDGTWSEVAGFVNVLASHRLAEQCAERLHKGSALFVEGRLQSRKYEVRSGQTRSVLEIKADQVQFLDRREGEPGEENDAEPPRAVEGDLPF